MSKTRFLMDAETAQHDQSCALHNFGFLHEALDNEIDALRGTKAETCVSIDYLQSIADAMFSVYGTMYRNNQQLKQAVEEEFARREEDGK